MLTLQTHDDGKSIDIIYLFMAFLQTSRRNNEQPFLLIYCKLGIGFRWQKHEKQIDIIWFECTWSASTSSISFKISGVHKRTLEIHEKSAVYKHKHIWHKLMSLWWFSRNYKFIWSLYSFMSFIIVDFVLCNRTLLSNLLKRISNSEIV